MRFASRGGSRFKIDLRAKFRDQAERVSRERGLGFGAERDRDRRRRAGLFPAKRSKRSGAGVEPTERGVATPPVLKTGTQSRRLQRIRPKTAARAPVCAPVAVRRTATLS